jgi:hypothetical protein
MSANLARRGDRRRNDTAGYVLLFYVNGRRVAIERPDPTTLLVDWLRSDEIGLTGTKLSCGEGVPTWESRGDVARTNNAAVAGSRALGEPPFVLSTSVFFAIKQAIMAARRDGGDATWFTMPAPATVGRIREHCRVARGNMRL